MPPTPRPAADPEKIVLVCNPGAGGRWRKLAGILDSAEAVHARRVVTDRIEDIGPALDSLGQRTRLLCIYGGDGTIQKILTRLFETRGHDVPPVALLGGGTMNVTSGFCGWGRSPEENFRQVVQGYLAGRLVTREVPLLEIRQGGRVEYGFTWGAGTIVHLLDLYENGGKGKAAALQLVATAGAAALTGWPSRMRGQIDQVPAEILVDGERLPWDRWIGTFCNTTGVIEIGVWPFKERRRDDRFLMLAYSVPGRDVITFLPFLARGMIPIDPKALLSKGVFEKVRRSFLGTPSQPPDPKYVNGSAREYEYRSAADPVFTIDGEIFQSSGEPVKVRLGPPVRLVIPE